MPKMTIVWATGNASRARCSRITVSNWISDCITISYHPGDRSFSDFWHDDRLYWRWCRTKRRRWTAMFGSHPTIRQRWQRQHQSWDRTTLSEDCLSCLAVWRVSEIKVWRRMRPSYGPIWDEDVKWEYRKILAMKEKCSQLIKKKEEIRKILLSFLFLFHFFFSLVAFEAERERIAESVWEPLIFRIYANSKSMSAMNPHIVAFDRERMNVIKCRPLWCNFFGTRINSPFVGHIFIHSISRCKQGFDCRPRWLMGHPVP